MNHAVLVCRFLSLNYIVPSSWVHTYLNIPVEEVEDEKNPLSMEGFGQAISLFLVRGFLVSSYRCPGCGM